jgi:hypothetical protein
VNWALFRHSGTGAVLENSTQDRRPLERRSLGFGSKLDGGSALLRSAVTNGSTLLPGVDGRSLWARRFRDLIAHHVADLGGEGNVSQAQMSLIRRAAALTVELERWEGRFAAEDGAPADELDKHQRCTNTLRRTLEALGLERKTRDITHALVTRIRAGEL